MKLGAWLTGNGVSEADFGRRIGVSRASVERYVDGTRIPVRETMAAISRETAGHVTANDFYDLSAGGGGPQPAASAAD